MNYVIFVFVIATAPANSQIRDYLSDLRRLLSDNVQDTVNFQDVYDFVVVGAGSGGSVVANRLTENNKWSVLLLEAGNDENFLTDVPLLAAFHTSTSYNWGYTCQPSKTACLGLIDGRCNLVRGKALGGTSVINFLLYNRGHKLDFDQWANAGNKGWSYDEILPYSLKSENCSTCHGIHGKNGYLSVENPGYESPLVRLFLESGRNLGYPVGDVSGSTLGFSKVLATMRRGSRCSASKAFLKPVLHRRNLHVSLRTLVTKILIHPQTKTAQGVEFLKNRKRYRIQARKEVILAAGSINTPHLLMLSGIGPKPDLEKLQIPVLRDLKVGYNLQDHVSMSTLAFFVNQQITVSDQNVQNPGDVFRYIFNGTGPYTIPGGAEALAFVQTKYAKVKNYPDVELVLGAGALNGDLLGTLRGLLRLPKSFFNKVYGKFVSTPAFAISPVLMRPKSRGRVLLKSSNPLHWPLIVPNYYESEEDVAVMVEGIKLAITVATSRSFQKFNATLNTVPFPGCEHLPFGSDPYWVCTLRHVSSSLGHQVGTCKMGPTTDPEAVVDPELKVHGTQGLRVVDGSIMPDIVAGHPNAAIMMIGEKASDMIKKEWGHR